MINFHNILTVFSEKSRIFYFTPSKKKDLLYFHPVVDFKQI